jgi:hypothetical protein
MESSIDVMPSVLTLLGIEVPPGLQGRSWFEPTTEERDGWPRSISVVAEGRSGTASVLVPGFKYSFDQPSGRERLLALPEEEDGPNLRWERPVTFAYLAAEASRILVSPEQSAASKAAQPIPDDVKDALHALGYAE